MSEIYIPYQQNYHGVNIMSEEVETSKMLENLIARIDELTKAIKEKSDYTEDKIRERPLAYVAGAFVGGLIVGYLVSRGKGQ